MEGPTSSSHSSVLVASWYDGRLVSGGILTVDGWDVDINSMYCPGVASRRIDEFPEKEMLSHFREAGNTGQHESRC